MKISLVAGLLALMTLTGCASTLQRLKEQEQLSYTEYAGEPVKSFWLSRFDGWSAVDDDQLVVWSGVNKAYLIKVVGFCPDLKFANAIGITSTAGTVDKFEKVIVGRDRCMISEIRPIDVKQMKADRKALREQNSQAS